MEMRFSKILSPINVSKHKKHKISIDSNFSKDFQSGSIISSLWMNFDQAISSIQLDKVVPDTPIISSAGLSSLLKLIQGISKNIYHKSKIKILSNI